MSRDRKRRSPHMGGSGGANAWAGQGHNITGIEALSSTLQLVLTTGPERMRVVATIDEDGRIGPVVYISDRLTHQILAVSPNELEGIAAACPSPLVAQHLRHIYAQFKAEQYGQAGHA